MHCLMMSWQRFQEAILAKNVPLACGTFPHNRGFAIIFSKPHPARAFSGVGGHLLRDTVNSFQAGLPAERRRPRVAVATRDRVEGTVFKRKEDKEAVASVPAEDIVISSDTASSKAHVSFSALNICNSGVLGSSLLCRSVIVSC